jgi:secreted trypsin-like serine protease
VIKAVAHLASAQRKHSQTTLYLVSITLLLGWGLIHRREMNEPPHRPSDRAIELQAVKQTVQSAEDCEDSYNSFQVNNFDKMTMNPNWRFIFLKDYEFCVNGGLRGICNGDSGGPLVCEGTNSKNNFCQKVTVYKYQKSPS